MSGDIYIGYGVAIRWIDDDAGIVWRHSGCRAWSEVYLKPHERSTGHAIYSGGPNDLPNLTIIGTLVCPGGCGTQGLISGGRWVPA